MTYLKARRTVENALWPVADEPKLLDFRPIESHGLNITAPQEAEATRIGVAVMTYTHQDYMHSARKPFLPDPQAPPGFKSTALCFERLAQKEMRDPDRRQRLLEVARFYRSLAGIIPAMPTRYKGNGAALPVTRAERWRARAEECRTLADCFTDQTCREQLTQLARDYDQMAVAAE